MAKTYNEIYIDTRRELKNAGIQAYALEARLLVAHAAGKTVSQFMRDYSLYASPSFAEEVKQMTRRRIEGEPVAYITGSWEFYGVPLEITGDVLIPRSDTELIPEAAITLFSGRNPRPRILDLCTGSGCIGIALAVKLPGARVVLADNDHRALSVCRKNVQKNKLESRVFCVDADATQKPPMLMGKFDLLVCNAPYIPTAELETLDSSVKDYEPIHALDGGEDGLDIIRPVIRKWKTVLRDGGAIMLEIGEGQAPAVEALLAEAGFSGIGALLDPGGTERVMLGHI